MGYEENLEVCLIQKSHDLLTREMIFFKQKRDSVEFPLKVPESSYVVDEALSKKVLKGDGNKKHPGVF